MLQKRIAQKIQIAAAVLSAACVLALFVTAQSVTAAESVDGADDVAEATVVALDFVRSSPTFAFDGIEGTLTVDSIDVMESYPPQYVVHVTFDSAHGGFGDRTGQFLTQAITPHMVEVLVSEGVVMSAVTDGQWDEANHQFVLKGPVPDDQMGFPQLGVPFELQIDKSAFIESEGLQLVLKNVEDSRCPEDVTCIREGDVKVTVQLVHNDVELGNLVLVKGEGGKDVKNMRAYSVRLLSVAPYPLSTQQTDVSDYVVIMSVSQVGLLSPVRQVAGGVEPQDVVCEDGLILIQKVSKMTPACVVHATAQKLLERGWELIETGEKASPKQIPNPASANCFDNGGKIVMRQTEYGVSGICVFPNGSECEEWEYLRGQCHPASDQP